MSSVIRKIATDKTFLITLFLAIIAFIFGHVTVEDIDLKTILSLLSLIIIVSVYEQLHVLKYIANTVVIKCRSTRDIIRVMLLFSFVGSMLFTNDVAILTLVPIFFKISQQVAIKKIVPISLLTIYANLGSALTPFGNPQNLYLVSFYQLSLPTFLGMSIPLGLIGLICLFAVSFLFPAKPIDNISTDPVSLDHQKVWWLILATVIVLFGILSFIAIWWSLLASVLSAFLLDKQVFQQVDYGIILTFINFFIIVGAVSRIDIIHQLLVATTQTQFHAFFAAIISSQFVSNVPAAVLLSKFTDHFYGIYLGVTVGGLGTLIASLANLLALRQYNIFSQDRTSVTFFKTFTWLNLIYLIIFVIIGSLILFI
ncbi:SLC13 family permease [Leuconostoc citreum]